jgi:hypothetical protein
MFWKLGSERPGMCLFEIVSWKSFLGFIFFRSFWVLFFFGVFDSSKKTPRKLEKAFWKDGGDTEEEGDGAGAQRGQKGVGGIFHV